MDLRRLFRWPRRTQISGGAFVDFPNMPSVSPMSPAVFSTNPPAAMRIPAVYRAVSSISADLSRVPMVVSSYDYDEDRWSRFERSELPGVYAILNDEANQYQTATDFKTWMVQMALLWGNSFAVISRKAGELYQLIPQEPSAVQLNRTADGEWIYNTAEYGEVPPADMLHFRMPGTTRLGWGDSPVASGANALLLARLLEIAGIEQYRMPGIGKVAIQTEEAVGAESVRAMQDAFKNAHSGADGMLRPIIVQNGASVDQIGQSLVDNDWINGRRSAVEDVARIFGIPPFVLYAETNNTFTLEQARAYGQSLQNYADRFGAELSCKLFPDEYDVRVSFDVSTMMRGTFSESVAAYQTAIQTGIMVPNEARAEMGLPPIDGGDDLYVGPNMQAGETTDDEDADATDDDRPGDEPAL